jgi:hypothetical protein
MKDEPISFKLYELAKAKGYSDPNIYLPTQSLLKTWFRTQQIFIDILTDQTTEPKFTYQINKFVGNPNDLTEKVWYWELPIISEYLYKTYEECLEVAEQEALKLLP